MIKKALVVVDMQNDFVTGVLGTPEAQSIVPAVADFVKNFDGDVFFTMDTHKDDYMNTQEGKRLPVKHCVKGTNGWEIVPELKAAWKKAKDSEKVAEKNVFGSVKLGQTLEFFGFDEIHFVGVCTGICVISNAVIAKANLPEARIVVHKDLCACVTPESHQTALDAMALLQMDII